MQIDTGTRLVGHVGRGVALACIFLSGSVYCQDDVIRIDTNMVTLPVSVLDRNGRYVTDLKKGDFEIFEDGVRQDIETFETADEPCTVFLLLDVGGKMYPQWNQIAEVASIFVKQLRPTDTLIAARFGEYIKMVVKPTKVANLRSTIKLEPIDTKYRNSVVFDAVALAQKKLEEIPGRKAILLLSDGVGEEYFSSAKRTLKKAEEEETLVYSIKFPIVVRNSKHIDRERVMREIVPKYEAAAREYMSELSARTGGRYFDIREMEDLEGVFREIALELRQQYNLGYYTKNSKGGSRQIRVKVNRPDVAVRARSSFVFVK